jgi:hypothetical protein
MTTEYTAFSFLVYYGNISKRHKMGTMYRKIRKANQLIKLSIFSNMGRRRMNAIISRWYH